MVGKTCSEKASSFNQKKKMWITLGMCISSWKCCSAAILITALKKIKNKIYFFYLFFYHAVAFIWWISLPCTGWLGVKHQVTYLLIEFHIFILQQQFPPEFYLINTPTHTHTTPTPFLASCIHTPCLQSQLLFITLYRILDPVLNHCGAILFPLHWFTNCIGANPETLQPHRNLGHTCGTSTSGHCRKAAMWTF